MTIRAGKLVESDTLKDMCPFSDETDESDQKWPESDQSDQSDEIPVLLITVN